MKKILRFSISTLFALILIFSTAQNTSFSEVQINEPLTENKKLKFDHGFEKKINDMINAGEKREYDVIIYVKKASEKLDTKSGVKKFGLRLLDEPGFLDAKSVAKKNKDKLENTLINLHRAKNVHKAQVLSFVTASVPIDQIKKLANYDYVVAIGDGERKMELELNVSRPTINAENLSFNGNGVRVSVIDTGIRQFHLDMPNVTKIIRQVTCFNNGSCNNGVTPANHGTHVAGIIAGLGTIDNNFRGIAPGALLLNAFNAGNNATSFGYALDWSLENGAKVINVSLGFPPTVPCGSDIENRMVDEAVDEGALVVKSAGNDGPNQGTITDPGCSYNTIVVGNMNDMGDANRSNDVIWNGPNDASSHGPTFDGRLKPEIVAPGTLINSTDLTLNYCEVCPDFGTVTGTSFAAAHVSGTAALVLEAHPEYSPLEVKAALLIGAEWKGNATTPTTASAYESGGSNDPTLNTFGLGYLDVNKTLTFANSGKNIIKDVIHQNQIKKYTFSANNGTQVKVILSWFKHTLGTVTAPQNTNVSNLNFNITRFDTGAIVAASNSMKQNNEFAVFNAPVTGFYQITVTAPFIEPEGDVNTNYAQMFALASTHQINKGSFLVKEGNFIKVANGLGRPISDLSVGGWTVTPLYQKLNETTADDTTFVTSPTGTNPEFQVKLSSLPQPQNKTDHIITFRASAPGGSGQGEKADAILLQGANQIAETGMRTLNRTGFSSHAYFLTTAEKNSITDYTNLSIKIVTSKGSSEVIKVSWIKFDVPPPPSDQPITGLGFKPKALMLFTTRQISNGFDDAYNISIGFSNGTSSRTIGVASDDNQSTELAGRTFGPLILKIPRSGCAVSCDGGTAPRTANAYLTSFDNDGFTIHWGGDFTAASIIHYVALGGDDLTKASVSTFTANTFSGNQAVTDLGFKPDFVMFMHPSSTFDDVISLRDGHLNYGFATSNLERGSLSFTIKFNVSPATTFGLQRTDRAITAVNASTGTIESEADIVSMNDNGFTINWLDPPSSAHKIFYLALKGGAYNVGNFAKVTSSGPVTQKVTNTGFGPTGILLTSFNSVASTSVQSNNRLSLGATDGASEGSVWVGERNAVSPTITARSITTTKVIRLATEQATGPSSTIDAEADLVSLDRDGFTLNWSTNNDGLAKQILYVAFGMPDGIVNLSDNNGVSVHNDRYTNNIATSGSNVYVSWEDNTLQNRCCGILFKRATDNGANFGPIITLSNDSGIANQPITAASGNNAYVLWTTDGSGNYEVFLARSTNNGTTFAPVTNLSNSPDPSVSTPGLAASGNNVYAVWEEQLFVDFQVFFRRSTDSGANFNATINLSNDAVGHTSRNPAIAASGSNVYVVWDGSFRRSTDNGANFDPTINLGNGGQTRVAASGNNVYVLWDSGDVFFRRSTDSGANFNATINLSNSAANSQIAFMAASGNNVYVVWSEGNGPNTEIFYRRSTDNGATFGSSVNLSNDPRGTDSIRIAASGSNVYVVWGDDAIGLADVYLKKSTDNGATFEPTINLTNNLGESVRPRIALSATNVYIDWEEDATAPADMFFIRTR